MKTLQKKPNNAIKRSIDRLNKIGNNDEVFTILMLRKFIAISSECIENLSSALITSDWIRLKATAHKNIASYCAMGFKELTELLEKAETNALKESEQKNIHELIWLINEKNNKIISDIKTELDLMAGAENVSHETGNKNAES